MNILTNKKIISIILGVIIVVVGLIFLLPSKGKVEKAFLEKHNLKGLNIEQILEKLEDSTDEDPTMFASIKSTKLMMGDEENIVELKVPSNKFYLSLAPYINNTHPCGDHNLITCRGELKNVTVHILVKDSSGKVIVDDDFTSYNNEFIGVWLPKDIKGTITVNYNGLSATTDISTNENTGTCLTTLKLN